MNLRAGFHAALLVWLLICTSLTVSAPNPESLELPKGAASMLSLFRDSPSDVQTRLISISKSKVFITTPLHFEGDSISVDAIRQPLVIDIDGTALVPATVVLDVSNLDQSASVEVLDAASDARTVQVVDFNPTTLGPLEKTRFSVLFLPEKPGPVSASLSLDTSEGPLSVIIRGNVAQNRFGLQSFVNITVPLGSTITPGIFLYNPTDELVKILEAFTTESFLHLTLPDQPTGQPRIWAIAGQTRQLVVSVVFHATTIGTHEGYVHLETDAGLFVVPVSINVVQNALMLSPPRLDFGPLVKSSQSKTGMLSLVNQGFDYVSIQSVFPSTPDRRLRVSVLPDLVIPPRSHIRNAIVLEFKGRSGPEEAHGTLQVVTNSTTQPILTAEYTAVISRGFLEYQQSDAVFSAYLANSEGHVATIQALANRVLVLRDMLQMLEEAGVPESSLGLPETVATVLLGISAGDNHHRYTTSHQVLEALDVATPPAESHLEHTDHGSMRVVTPVAFGENGGRVVPNLELRALRLTNRFLIPVEIQSISLDHPGFHLVPPVGHTRSQHDGPDDEDSHSDTLWGYLPLVVPPGSVFTLCRVLAVPASSGREPAVLTVVSNVSEHRIPLAVQSHEMSVELVDQCDGVDTTALRPASQASFTIPQLPETEGAVAGAWVGGGSLRLPRNGQLSGTLSAETMAAAHALGDLASPGWVSSMLRENHQPAVSSGSSSLQAARGCPRFMAHGSLPAQRPVEVLRARAAVPRIFDEECTVGSSVEVASRNHRRHTSNNNNNAGNGERDYNMLQPVPLVRVEDDSALIVDRYWVNPATDTARSRPGMYRLRRPRGPSGRWMTDTHSLMHCPELQLLEGGKWRLAVLAGAEGGVRMLPSHQIVAEQRMLSNPPLGPQWEACGREDDTLQQRCSAITDTAATACSHDVYSSYGGLLLGDSGPAATNHTCRHHLSGPVCWEYNANGTCVSHSRVVLPGFQHFSAALPADPTRELAQALNRAAKHRPSWRFRSANASGLAGGGASLVSSQWDLWQSAGTEPPALPRLQSTLMMGTAHPHTLLRQVLALRNRQPTRVRTWRPVSHAPSDLTGWLLHPNCQPRFAPPWAAALWAGQPAVETALSALSLHAAGLDAAVAALWDDGAHSGGLVEWVETVPLKPCTDASQPQHPVDLCDNDAGRRYRQELADGLRTLRSCLLRNQSVSTLPGESASLLLLAGHRWEHRPDHPYPQDPQFHRTLLRFDSDSVVGAHTMHALQVSTPPMHSERDCALRPSAADANVSPPTRRTVAGWLERVFGCVAGLTDEDFSTAAPHTNITTTATTTTTTTTTSSSQSGLFGEVRVTGYRVLPDRPEFPLRHRVCQTPRHHTDSSVLSTPPQTFPGHMVRMVLNVTNPTPVTAHLHRVNLKDALQNRAAVNVRFLRAQLLPFETAAVLEVSVQAMSPTDEHNYLPGTRGLPAIPFQTVSATSLRGEHWFHSSADTNHSNSSDYDLQGVVRTVDCLLSTGDSGLDTSADYGGKRKKGRKPVRLPFSPQPKPEFYLTMEMQSLDVSAWALMNHRNTMRSRKKTNGGAGGAEADPDASDDSDASPSGGKSDSNNKTPTRYSRRRKSRGNRRARTAQQQNTAANTRVVSTALDPTSPRVCGAQGELCRAGGPEEQVGAVWWGDASVTHATGPTHRDVAEQTTGRTDDVTRSELLVAQSIEGAFLEFVDSLQRTTKHRLLHHRHHQQQPPQQQPHQQPGFRLDGVLYTSLHQVPFSLSGHFVLPSLLHGHSRIDTAAGESLAGTLRTSGNTTAVSLSPGDLSCSDTVRDPAAANRVMHRYVGGGAAPTWLGGVKLLKIPYTAPGEHSPSQLLRHVAWLDFPPTDAGWRRTRYLPLTNPTDHPVTVTALVANHGPSAVTPPAREHTADGVGESLDQWSAVLAGVLESEQDALARRRQTADTHQDSGKSDRDGANPVFTVGSAVADSLWQPHRSVWDATTDPDDPLSAVRDTTASVSDATGGDKALWGGKSTRGSASEHAHVSVVIPPHSAATLGPIHFTPPHSTTDSQTYSALLYLKSNWTAVERVWVTGTAGHANLSIAFDDAPHTASLRLALNDGSDEVFAAGVEFAGLDGVLDGAVAVVLAQHKDTPGDTTHSQSNQPAERATLKLHRACGLRDGDFASTACLSTPPPRGPTTLPSVNSIAPFQPSLLPWYERPGALDHERWLSLHNLGNVLAPFAAFLGKATDALQTHLPSRAYRSKYSRERGFPHPRSPGRRDESAAVGLVTPPAVRVRNEGDIPAVLYNVQMHVKGADGRLRAVWVCPHAPRVAHRCPGGGQHVSGMTGRSATVDLRTATATTPGTSTITDLGSDDRTVVLGRQEFGVLRVPATQCAQLPVVLGPGDHWDFRWALQPDWGLVQVLGCAKHGRVSCDAALPLRGLSFVTSHGNLSRPLQLVLPLGMAASLHQLAASRSHTHAGDADASAAAGTLSAGSVALYVAIGALATVALVACVYIVHLKKRGRALPAWMDSLLASVGVGDAQTVGTGTTTSSSEPSNEKSKTGKDTPGDASRPSTTATTTTTASTTASTTTTTTVTSTDDGAGVQGSEHKPRPAPSKKKRRKRGKSRKKKPQGDGDTAGRGSLEGPATVTPAKPKAGSEGSGALSGKGSSDTVTAETGGGSSSPPQSHTTSTESTAETSDGATKPSQQPQQQQQQEGSVETGEAQETSGETKTSAQSDQPESKTGGPDSISQASSAATTQDDTSTASATGSRTESTATASPGTATDNTTTASTTNAGTQGKRSKRRKKRNRKKSRGRKDSEESSSSVATAKNRPAADASLAGEPAATEPGQPGREASGASAGSAAGGGDASTIGAHSSTVYARHAGGTRLPQSHPPAMIDENAVSSPLAPEVPVAGGEATVRYPRGKPMRVPVLGAVPAASGASDTGAPTTTTTATTTATASTTSTTHRSSGTAGASSQTDRIPSHDTQNDSADPLVRELRVAQNRTTAHSPPRVGAGAGGPVTTSDSLSRSPVSQLRQAQRFPDSPPQRYPSEPQAPPVVRFVPPSSPPMDPNAGRHYDLRYSSYPEPHPRSPGYYQTSYEHPHSYQGAYPDPHSQPPGYGQPYMAPQEHRYVSSNGPYGGYPDTAPYHEQPQYVPSYSRGGYYAPPMHHPQVQPAPEGRGYTTREQQQQQQRQQQQQLQQQQQQPPSRRVMTASASEFIPYEARRNAPGDGVRRFRPPSDVRGGRKGDETEEKLRSDGSEAPTDSATGTKTGPSAGPPGAEVTAGGGGDVDASYRRDGLSWSFGQATSIGGHDNSGGRVSQPRGLSALRSPPPSENRRLWDRNQQFSPREGGANRGGSSEGQDGYDAEYPNRTPTRKGGVATVHGQDGGLARGFTPGMPADSGMPNRTPQMHRRDTPSGLGGSVYNPFSSPFGSMMVQSSSPPSTVNNSRAPSRASGDAPRSANSEPDAAFATNFGITPSAFDFLDLSALPSTGSPDSKHAVPEEGIGKGTEDQEPAE